MGDQDLRMRMELLAERLQVLSDEHDPRNRPGDDDADWHRAQAAAYTHASDLVRQELARP